MAGVETRRLGESDRDSPPLRAGEQGRDWSCVRATDRRAALRLLHPHRVKAPAVVARFDREAQVIGRLRRPGVVELIAAGISDDGRPYLCMELLEGEDLAAVVERGGPL